MDKKRKLDVHSISFRLWIYFMLFAVALVAAIWALQSFFLNNYYEEMKKSETASAASEIRLAFLKSQGNVTSLRKTIDRVSLSDDLTVIIRDEDGLPVIDNIGGRDFMPGLSIGSRYEKEILQLQQQLAGSEFDSTTRISKDGRHGRTLEFACKLSGAVGKGSAKSILPGEDQYIMYIFSPLYPVKSTINILRSQLKYITLISLIMAFAIAMLIARRISRPIRSITHSAAEMGRGNYSVTFKGSGYTEIQELADTLTMAKGEMEKTGQYQQDLIANVSHDLRTPLTMIRSYAEMIRDLSGDNPVKRNAHLKVIIDEADRLNVLVNDMLNLSRMQSKRMLLIHAPFDLRQAAEQILASYKILEETEGYHITVNLAKGPVYVNGDEEKLKQVMNNLMTNAVKYCGEDKVIIVTLKRSGRKVRFSVQDHGMGIAPEEVPHIWEKYYQSSTHHVRAAEGTGLGLSIVKEILTLHHAEFDVKTAVGKGSTFWFELPVIRPARQNRLTGRRAQSAPESPEPDAGAETASPADAGAETVSPADDGAETASPADAGAEDGAQTG